MENSYITSYIGKYDYRKESEKLLMNPMKKAYDHNQPKAKPFKFSDSFLTGFNTMISAYDKKIEELHKVNSLIDNSAHHGIYN